MRADAAAGAPPVPICTERPLVLASRSPRRSELLRRAGLPLLVRPVAVAERLLPGEGHREAVQRLAREKAAAAWQPGDWVLAADTLVVVGGQVLGKPVDRAEAARMLRSLSGREHEVVTGYALLDPAGQPAGQGCVSTLVSFGVLADDVVAAYLDSGEPFGKAGGYAIQGIGAALVCGIRGSYTNVVGLPLWEVLGALAAAGALAGSPLAAGTPALEDVP